MVATFQETQALRGHLIGALTGFSCASIYAFIQSILSILKCVCPPFHIFRHYATVSERKKIQKFQVFFQKKSCAF